VCARACRRRHMRASCNHAGIVGVSPCVAASRFGVGAYAALAFARGSYGHNYGRPTSAPELHHICAGTRPHLCRDSATSAPATAAYARTELTSSDASMSLIVACSRACDRMRMQRAPRHGVHGVACGRAHV
jgi:hypothetical protein